jgi:hypothetical protein
MADAHDIVSDIKRVAVHLGKTPTVIEYSTAGKYSERKIRTVFNSWNEAIKAASLTENSNSIQRAKFKYKPTKIHSFNVKEYDLEELFKTSGSPDSLKMISMSDLHYEYRDKAALTCFLKFTEWFKPDIFNIIGDFPECEGASHWPSQTFDAKRLVPEMKGCRELLSYICDIIPKHTKKIYLTGNHEDWISQACIRVPEMFSGLEDLDMEINLSRLLNLDKFKFDLIPLNHFIKIGKAYFTHGVYHGDNHPKKHLMELKANIYYGHTHDTKSYDSPSLGGVLHAQSIGTLRKLDAPFMKGKPNNWRHAFGVHEFYRDGSYSFICPQINDGKLSLFGQTFNAEEK